MFIAQSPAAPTRDIYMLLLILIAFVTVASLVGLWLYRRMTRPLEDDQPEAGFTLSDLRRLHREGQMSDEEFERARGRLIAAVKYNANEPSPPGGPEDEPPDPSDPPDQAHG